MKALIVTPRKVLALFLLLSLVACGGDGANRVEEGDRLGVLHIGNAAEPAALDPHITTGVSESHIINALFEGLVIKNPATLEPEPAVAERWEVSEDGRTYTFHLREDALWSNGEPLTAEDFRWSWMRALMPELGSQYNYMFFSIVNAQEFAEGRLDDFSQVGVEVLGPHTLQVRLREATPYFLQLLDHHSTYPVNRGSVEALGSASDRLSRWARVGNLVGNGPFTLVEWRTNSHIRVEKNPLYWDAETTQLNAIVFYAIDNQATEERMFRDGQLHHTYDVPLDKVPVYLAENPELIRIEPYLGTYFYGINTSRPGLDDARVRATLHQPSQRVRITRCGGRVRQRSRIGVNADTQKQVPKDNRLKTPLMGWASWNNFRAEINEDIIKAQTDAMVSSGLMDVGYNFINTDDGIYGGRDADGNILAHPERFPSGMKSLAEYIHSKGLYAGIYSDAGHKYVCFILGQRHYWCRNGSLWS